MRNKTYRFTIAMALVTVICFLVVFPGASKATPKRELWSCYDVGSSGYIQASSMADALLKKYGIRVRLTPSGTSIGRLMPVVNKKVKYGFLANEVYCAVEGIYEFSTIEWGPQDLRVLLAHPTSIGPVTTKDSGIKTLADAKGKRWSYFPSSTSTIKMDGYLAFAGYGWEGVIPVQFPGYAQASSALKEGKVDVSSFSFTSAHAYELESHPKGIHYLEFDPNDKEALARMQKFAPFMSVRLETVGASLSKDKGVYMPYYRYPMITVRTDAGADEVYEFVKKIDEAFPLYKDVYPPNDLWAIEEAGIPPADAPFHEGAIRYLKEKGVWKPEHDKWNQERIAHLEKVKKLWDECLDTIDKMSDQEREKVKGPNFAKYWLDFRESGLK